MASPLVRTKLFTPRLRRRLVARSRVNTCLDRGAEVKLVLVSAPAGFGKTTAVVSWLEQAPEGSSVAWLSLDEGDRRASSFWTYVVTALQAVVPGVADGVLELLQSANPPVKSVLATALNELGALPNDLYLVLDDYHLVDGPVIGEGMVFLLEHLPPQVHVVLITRSDPALPLGRLRVRGELLELRAADLRFTPDEVAVYFHQTDGLALTESEIAVLEARTEGWIAALQLTALSMQGRPDVARFIDGFAGDNSFIVDYLVEEVLARQSEQLRSFLLQTSVLDRLSGDLCDAVTGRADGKAMLEAVSRANLFLVPLDDNRTWYRYHQLFADVLLTHLRDERPNQLAGLHSRASRWCEKAGEASPAVRHALAAGDLDRAAGLVELALPGLRRDRQEATIRGWLDLIPDAMVRSRPILAIGFIGALMAAGEFGEVPERLRELGELLHLAEDVGGDAPSLKMVVVDKAELDRLAGVVELYWAALALLEGDVAATHRHSKQAIRRAAPGDHVTRSGASAVSGLAYWAAGDLEAAHRAYSASLDGFLGAGHISDVLACSIAMADIQLTQGRLGDALATYEHALALAARQPGVIRGTADMHVGICQILLERGELEPATQHLQRSQELGEHLGLPQNAYRWRRAQAMMRATQGDLAAAIQLVGEAEGVYTTDFSPDVSPLHALKARFFAAEANIAPALSWAREHHLSVDELTYLHEYEHITLARVLLGQSRTQHNGAVLRRALDLLERLLVAAEQGERTGSVIEILVVQALARHHAGDDNRAALAPLKRALMLAEPEGHVRIFAAEGANMATLLQRLVKEEANSTYVPQLLSACREHAIRSGGTLPCQRPDTQGLLDPLSDRELEVLRLLATELNGPELARHLSVSLNTLRTHTKNIFAKLGVNSRRAAVHRAAELELLPGNRDS